MREAAAKDTKKDIEKVQARSSWQGLYKKDREKAGTAYYRLVRSAAKDTEKDIEKVQFKR